MNEVAEPTAHTSFAAVEPAARLAEVGDGAELAVDRARAIPATIQRIARLLRRVLVLEARIHVADQVIVVIIAHHHLLDLAVLAHLAPEVLVEGVEVVLELLGVHAALEGVVVGRVLVHVREEDGLGVGGLDVLAGAAVAVAAGADFVVEAAVDLVLLGAEDGSEVVSHACVGSRCKNG